MLRKIARVVGTIALLAGLCAGGAGLAGCEVCTVQSRVLELRVSQTLGGASAEAALTLRQNRGSDEGRFVIWFVRVSPLAGTAGQVQLRAGTPASPGRLLYRFPLLNAVPASGVITRVFEDTPYGGLVPFAELWDLVQQDPVFVEVIDAVSAEVLHIGPLVLTDSTDWQDVCT